MKNTYESWANKIKAGWAKDEAKAKRAGKKMDKAIARGEYLVNGEYKHRDGRIGRIVTKV